MTDNNEMLKTVWGSVPAPSAEEVNRAWQQMLERRRTDIEAGITEPGTKVRMIHLNEFIEASPAIFQQLAQLRHNYAEARGNPTDAEAYSMGVYDFIEILGTVAMNRQVDAIEAQFPPQTPELG